MREPRALKEKKQGQIINCSQGELFLLIREPLRDVAGEEGVRALFSGGCGAFLFKSHARTTERQSDSGPEFGT